MENFTPSDKYSSQLLVRILASDLELNERLKAAQNKLSKFALTCAEIGTKMEGLGQSLSAPFTRAISILADFDDQMRRVAAVTGASTANLQKMTDAAKQLGASTRYSASQVAGGMGALGMMGFSSREINSAISNVMDLATVTGTDLAEAASIAAN